MDSRTMRNSWGGCHKGRRPPTDDETTTAWDDQQDTTAGSDHQGQQIRLHKTIKTTTLHVFLNKTRVLGLTERLGPYMFYPRQFKTKAVLLRKEKNRRLRSLEFRWEHEGALNFTTDAWTSPNHKVFIAVTIHFEINGAASCLLLDLVEVVMSHSGVNLVAAFGKVLDDFGISEKLQADEVLVEADDKHGYGLASLISVLTFASRD
ncbi:hypothetical protein BD779DRAFT_1472008 [Infundibulicybe gibba]|nr:hypothetical protein BD779DRAFT_1472008 [Infundibulicybe gibba]